MSTETAIPLEVDKPEAADKQFDLVVQDTGAILEKAKILAGSIQDQQSFEDATLYRKQINMLKKSSLDRVREIFGAMEANAKAILDDIRGKKKQVEDPCDQAMAILDGPIGAYYDAQERARRAEEVRLAAEAKLLRDEAAVNAALNAVASGDAPKAEAIITKALDAAAPAVKLQKTQAGPGVSISYLYGIKEDTIDVDALFAAVAAGKIEKEAIMPNLTYLKAQARIRKDSFNYPGVELTKTPNVSSRK